MESVFVFLSDMYDTLEFDVNRKFSEDSADIAGIDHPDNSIKKAAKILENNFKFDVPHVTVTKKLPIAGGVGGGSSNAACFVNTVFDIWGFTLTEKMESLGLFRPLGADTSVFLFKYFSDLSGALYMNGTGLDGDIERIDLPTLGHYVVLVNDGSKLRTKQVFEYFNGEVSNPVGPKHITLSSISNFQNSLQPVAISMLPHINGVLNAISATEPLFCGVSGSGPSCLGYYDSSKAALSAQQALRCYDLVCLSSID
jgi:4-diphosphocytidyl-2-C-methyl-D-erythritol kinase